MSCQKNKTVRSIDCKHDGLNMLLRGGINRCRVVESLCKETYTQHDMTRLDPWVGCDITSFHSYLDSTGLIMVLSIDSKVPVGWLFVWQTFESSFILHIRCIIFSRCAAQRKGNRIVNQASICY